MTSSSVPVQHLFDLQLKADNDPQAFIPAGPHGTRAAVNVSGGTFKGPRMEGVVVSPGGDWLTLRPNGTIALDVRVLLVTDDGASILMQYRGIGSAERENRRELRNAPLFETGDERYAWLNDIQAVGIGYADVAALTVSYRVYAID